MKLYTSMGPNPQVARVFLKEKGLDIEMVDVDIVKGLNRQDDYLTKNPAGQVPCLETDDGQFVSEITAICEYIEERHPTPPLIGATPEERAECRMWTRRVDLNICENLGDGFRFGKGLKFFDGRVPVIPEAAEGLQRVAQERITWLDGLMEGKDFICGDRFTMADIVLHCMMTFFAGMGQAINEDNKNIVAWMKRVGDRPSMDA